MSNIEWDSDQYAAIMAASQPGDVLITGGAGTGKTTLIKAIAENFGGECDIMAPTGKAAARLKECTGRFASTIHRHLGWDGEKFRRKGTLKRPVIIDEASMLDSSLLAKLLVYYTPPKVVLVGDAAQLEPVGKGAPFHCLLALRPESEIHRLRKCYRASASVHLAANMIREGKSPPSRHKEDGESFRLIETGRAEETQAKILGWVRDGHLDPTRDIVLAPRYGEVEAAGDIKALNAGILAIVNPHTDGEKWKAGDRVICGKNFGPDDLWNGDIGTVTSVDYSGKPWVRLDRDREKGDVLLEPAMQRETAFAYCLSVHKAQGSQFRRVVVVCLRKNRHMLTRSLIYTAVTRAQEGCVVVGQLAAFFAGINNVREKRTVMQALGKVG